MAGEEAAPVKPLPNGWVKLKVSQLIGEGWLEIGDGYRAKNAEMAETGLPFVRAGDVNGRVNTIGVDLLGEASLPYVGNKRSKPGDAVITTKGTIGRMAFVRADDPVFIYSPQLCFWRSLDHSKVDPRWLYYALHAQEMRHQMSWSAAQTDMAPYISLSDQRTVFEITLPLIGDQVAIAGVLASLDNKIDLNRQMAATLEEMARALFKSWFVDFDPVHAKAEGRDTGLPANITALFPDNFDDKGLPKGWTWGTPENLVEVNPTTRIDRAKEAPYIDMAALPTQGHRIKSAVSRPVGSGARFKNGDTLLARITPCLENGKTAFVDCLDDDAIAWGSTEFIVMRPLDGTPEPLAYLIARDASFRSHIIASMSGTSGRQRAPAEAIGRWNMAIPTEAVISAWGDAVIPMFDGIKAKSVEAERLTDLRDTLLPMLLSGDLRVANAETAIAAA